MIHNFKTLTVLIFHIYAVSENERHESMIEVNTNKCKMVYMKANRTKNNSINNDDLKYNNELATKKPFPCCRPSRGFTQ